MLDNYFSTINTYYLTICINQSTTTITRINNASV